MPSNMACRNEDNARCAFPWVCYIAFVICLSLYCHLQSVQPGLTKHVPVQDVTRD